MLAVATNNGRIVSTKHQIDQITMHALLECYLCMYYGNAAFFDKPMILKKRNARALLYIFINTHEIKYCKFVFCWSKFAELGTQAVEITGV